MPTKSLGDTIQKGRAKRYELREFARMLEISPTRLSDIENDRGVSSEDLLGQIAHYLEFDFDQLMAAARRVAEGMAVRLGWTADDLLVLPLQGRSSVGSDTSREVPPSCSK